MLDLNVSRRQTRFWANTLRMFSVRLLGPLEEKDATTGAGLYLSMPTVGKMVAVGLLSKLFVAVNGIHRVMNANLWTYIAKPRDRILCLFSKNCIFKHDVGKNVGNSVDNTSGKHC